MKKQKTLYHNGIDIEDWNTRIYRVFSLNRFLAVLASSEMGLLNPSRWDDPFENFFLKCKIRGSDGTVTSMEEIYKTWYGQCWTYEPDSDAMWRIYSQDKLGVRVSTTINDLFKAIFDESDEFKFLNYFVGKVTYKSRAAIEDYFRRTSFWDIAAGGQTIGFAKLLCVKRMEFAHENEVRILRRADNNASSILNVRINPNELFKDLLLDPRLTSDEFAKIRSQLLDGGCRVPIHQSDLYTISDDLFIEET